MLSIPEEAGRLWLAGCSAEERGWVPRRELESLLGLMHEVVLLRVPLLFGRVHDGSFTLSEGGAVATRKRVDSGYYRTAASKAVICSGRHFTRFTMAEGNDLYFGVIQPGWDVEGGQGGSAQKVDGHCFYGAVNGNRFPGEHAWEGRQGARPGDRIGMLLDFDQGSMTVWKNDVRLGVMVAEGLRGPLCWAVTMWRQGCSAHQGCSARIESAPLPEQ